MKCVKGHTLSWHIDLNRPFPMLDGMFKSWDKGLLFLYLQVHVWMVSVSGLLWLRMWA